MANDGDDGRRRQSDRFGLEATAQRVGQLVGAAIDAENEKHGGPPAVFALMMFTVGEGGWATWVSNAQRDDMIKAMDEMVVRLRGGEDRH